MKYDNNELLVQPGQAVKLTFENGDDLPHNLVFCLAGTDTVAMAMKQMEKPEEALKRNWLPDDARIWAHSKMLNPHEKETLTFIAPEKPGTYPFVCTFPGHAVTMRGELKVAPVGEGLKDLHFALYLGSWKNLPDFSKLTPHREGKVEDNLIKVKLDDYKNEFGVVFRGKLVAPKKGSYRFYLSSDDGARVLIDGREVVTYDGIHPAGDIKEKAVTLEKGEHEYRLEYFQGGGQIDLYAAWKGPDFQITPLSTWLHPGWKHGTKRKEEIPSIPLVPQSEPVIYRNFIKGAGNRAIAVGYPGGVNIAWSAESMNIALLWRGAFMNAGRHWTSRGGGAEAPLGYDVLSPTGEPTPALHVTEQPEADWPVWDKVQRYAGFEWRGYTLDAARCPSFRYTWDGAQVTETFTAVPGDAPTLKRSVQITGNVPEHTWFRLAADHTYEPQGETFLCQKGGVKFRLTASGARLAGKNLVVPAKPGVLTITYQWVP
ncbi:MAG: PA14 domain-containing protein [Verrucomicrobiaceae bacterium]